MLRFPKKAQTETAILWYFINVGESAQQFEMVFCKISNYDEPQKGTTRKAWVWVQEMGKRWLVCTDSTRHHSSLRWLPQLRMKGVRGKNNAWKSGKGICGRETPLDKRAKYGTFLV